MEKDAGPGANLLTGEECALVVIDVQERLMPVIAGGVKIVQNTVRLVRFAQIMDIPVIITEQEKLGATLREIATEALNVQPIGKVHFNCFQSAEFQKRMQQINKRTIVLAGVEAHICVAQTALYGLPSFKVHVVADAIGSRAHENRDVALERVKQAGAVLTSTEMFIYEILQRAGTDKFKASLPLVK
jgi:nicotinamidase-related amidase